MLQHTITFYSILEHAMRHYEMLRYTIVYEDYSALLIYDVYYGRLRLQLILRLCRAGAFRGFLRPRGLFGMRGEASASGFRV